MAITQNGVLKRDDNDSPVMGGTSSADNATIINASFDPVTRRLLTDAAGGGGTPGGANTDVQYNDSGAFGGDANFTWDKVGEVLTIGGSSAINSFLGTTSLKFTNEGDSSEIFGSNAISADTNGTSLSISSGNGNGTGTAGAIAIFSNSTGLIIGGVAVGLSSNFPGLTINNATTVAYLNPTALSTNRTYAFPDKSGTFAMTSDISAAALTVGTTTISSGTTTRILYDNAGVLGEYTLTGSGTVVMMGTSPTVTTSLIMADAANIVINTTTGTKIGTGTTQKIGFYNATPIVQPTGDVITALQNLGLGASLTVAATTITSRTLWGQTYDGSANVTGSLSAVGNITGGASSMTITAGTGNSRTMILQTTTSGGAATIALTLGADQSATFAGAITNTTSGVLTTGTIELGATSDTTIARVSAGVISVEGVTVVLVNSSPTLGTITTTGNIELGNASDTTLSRSSAGVLAVEGVVIPSISSTNTLTNKRVTPRVTSAASYTTDTGSSLNIDTQDMFIVTAQTGALKFNNPSGTPTDGQKLIITVASSTTAARALTWDTAFGSTTVTLPTTTAATTATLSIGFIWSASKSLWQCVAVA